jgi:lysophospholipase L1-like esterase
MFSISNLAAQTTDTPNTNIIDLYPNGEIVSEYHNDWTRVHYKKRIETFKKNPLLKNEIVFIGNSITEKGRNWSEKFGIGHIRNRGISGDLTDGVLKRLDEITYSEPKAVFILIGVNDLYNLHHDETGKTNLKYFKIIPSAKYVAKNILKITKEIQKESPVTKIYVRTILPTRRTYLKKDIVKVNTLLAKNEKKGFYALIDIYSHFVNEEGLLHKKYTVDGVHLSEKGYEHWVSLEKDIIRKLTE